MLDGVVTDAVESRALSYRRDYVDIYTVSWGPSDDGETFDEPKDMTRKALKDGVQKVCSNVPVFVIYWSLLLS